MSRTCSRRMRACRLLACLLVLLFLVAPCSSISSGTNSKNDAVWRTRGRTLSVRPKISETSLRAAAAASNIASEQYIAGDVDAQTTAFPPTFSPMLKTRLTTSLELRSLTTPKTAPAERPISGLSSNDETTMTTSAPNPPSQRPIGKPRTGLILDKKILPAEQFNYIADPNALVVNDTVYLFCSHDPPNANPITKYSMMREYVLLTTTSLEEGGAGWINHGVILTPAVQFPKARILQGKMMFAPAVAHKDGFFYMYFPFLGNQEGESDVGVARSSTPTIKESWRLLASPMKRAGLFDPAVMITPDGRPFIYGNSRLKHESPSAHRMLGAQLADNMHALKSGSVPTQIYDGFVTEGVFAFWRKFNGKVTYYFLARVQNKDKVDGIFYYTSEQPTRRIFLWGANRLTPNQFDAPPHCSVVEFQERFYFFYHSGAENNGNRWKRSACMEELIFLPNGKIQPVKLSCKYARKA